MPQQITNEDDAKFIAEMIRDGTLTGERMENAFSALEAFRGQQNIDTSPFELPKPPDPNDTRIFQSTLGQPPTDPFTSEQRAVAAEGLDITSGSPVGRFASGFAQNEALRANDLQQRLSEHFGQDVRLSKGEHGLEFINPETNRRTLVDEVTSTFRDIADIAGPALPIGGAIVGSVGGAPGAAVGGGIGEGIRRGVGNILGVRDESLEEAGLGSIGVGILEGTLQKGGELAVRGAQRVRNFFKPPALSAEDAARALSAGEADQAIADEMSRRTGERFQPFTGQTSKDPTLLGGQSSALTSEQTGRALREQQAQNETILETLFDDLNPVAVAPDTATGRAIHNEARAQIQPRVQAAKDVTGTQIDELEELTAAIPQAENSVIVRQLGEAATEGRKVVKGFEDTAWNDVRAAMGHNPDTALSEVKIPVDGDLERTIARLQAEAKEAIDPAISSGKRALTPKKIRPAEELSPEDAALFDELGINPEGLSDGFIDLNQLQVHLSSLRRRLRLAKKGEVATDPQGRDIGRIKDELVAQRNAYLKENNPELLKLLEEAEGLTAKRATLFDEGLVGKLIRKEGGEWQLTDKELIGRTIGSGDKEAIEHLVAALSRHPAGVPTLQRTFLQLYRNDVVRNGIPDAALHREFIKTHNETINALFPGRSRILQLGEFERIVSRRVQRFTDFEKAVEKSFRGKIQNIASERIAEDILGKRFSVKEVGRLMTLAESAGVKAQYQAAVTGQIKRRFMSQTSGLQLNALDKFVKGNAERLMKIMGPQYVVDMRLLLSGLKTIRTSTGGIATTRNPTLIGSLIEGAARVTVARPLSPAGVGLTKAFRFRERAAQRILAAAISDPKVLRAIVAQGDKDIRSRVVGRLLAVLGSSSLIVDALNDAELTENREQ